MRTKGKCCYCDGPLWGKGLCRLHYQRWYYKRAMEAPVQHTALKSIEAGTRFGRLVVLQRGLNNKAGQAQWRCRCDCGTIRDVIGGSLRNGETRSCGCLIRETLIQRATKHGHAKRGHKDLTYNSWMAMKHRCSNTKNPAYKYYGGLGITVCARWSDFQNFLTDMGPRPSKQHSLDRLDPNKDYGPDNCRWATPSEQASNQRSIVELVLELQRYRAVYGDLDAS